MLMLSMLFMTIVLIEKRITVFTLINLKLHVWQGEVEQETIQMQLEQIIRIKLS
jgi:hypothetical protein